ncbi:unnamed protein product [Brassica rapa subsp. trilocularis]
MEFWDVFMKVTLYNFYSTSVWPLLLTVSMLFFRHEYRFINLFALRFKCTEIKHGKPINNVKQEDGYMFYVAQVTLGEAKKTSLRRFLQFLLISYSSKNFRSLISAKSPLSICFATRPLILWMAT